MILNVDKDGPAPPYEQLETQITALVASGGLAPGDKLPTVRGLAADLGLAPNTVARAYRELERHGVIQTRGRGGTFVAGDDVQSAARAAAATYVEAMRALGIGQREALDLVQRQLGRPSAGSH